MSHIIGRQMARIKFARDYFLVVMNLITALSMLTLALEAVGIEVTLPFFVLTIVIAIITFWISGYYIEKKGIIEADYEKVLTQTAKGQVIIWKKIWKEVIKEGLKEK